MAANKPAPLTTTTTTTQPRAIDSKVATTSATLEHIDAAELHVAAGARVAPHEYDGDVHSLELEEADLSVYIVNGVLVMD